MSEGTTDSGELELAEALALLERESAAPPALRARLVESARTTHRWDDLEARVASLLDIDAARARALLIGVDDAHSWTPGPAGHVELFHVEGGPAVAGAVTGFVKLPPGAPFPEHEHLGDEQVLVLQGALRDSGGRVARRGDLVSMAAGTAHAFEVVSALPLVYLVVVHQGVRIGGDVIGPDDPRG